jgi:hypothetical protein
MHGENLELMFMAILQSVSLNYIFLIVKCISFYFSSSQTSFLAYHKKKLNNFEIWPIVFIIEIGNMKLRRLPDSGGEFYNVVSNAAY